MTIAISSFNEGAIFISSDTKLSYEVERNPVAGAERPNVGLKIFFLSERLAITYSGTTETAHQIVGQAKKIAHEGGQVVANSLRDICYRSNDVEFLLADVSETPTVYKIGTNIFSRTTSERFWIGDSEAANRILQNASQSGFDTAQKIQELLQSRSISTVGGMAVTARGNVSGFKFVPKMSLISSSYAITASDEWKSIDWGSAADGGFGYTTLTPAEAGRNGWGIHFFQGYCGYFFKADLDTNTFQKLVWRPSRMQDAIRSLESDTGISIEFGGQLNNF